MINTKRKPALRTHTYLYFQKILRAACLKPNFIMQMEFKGTSAFLNNPKDLIKKNAVPQSRRHN